MAGTSFFHNLFKKFMGNFNQLNFIIQYNIFYKYRYFFFESVFKSLLNHRQKVSQIRNCIVCVVTRHVFVFWPSTGRCIVFQYIFGNQKKSEFYGPNSQFFLWLKVSRAVFLYSRFNITTLQFNYSRKQPRMACRFWEHAMNRVMRRKGLW